MPVSRWWNGGVDSVVRMIDLILIDLALLEESKATYMIYACSKSGYKVLAMDSPSKHQGDVLM